jgi:hypothetical protein
MVAGSSFQTIGAWETVLVVRLFASPMSILNTRVRDILYKEIITESHGRRIPGSGPHFFPKRSVPGKLFENQFSPMSIAPPLDSGYKSGGYTVRGNNY